MGNHGCAGRGARDADGRANEPTSQEQLNNVKERHADRGWNASFPLLSPPCHRLAPLLYLFFPFVAFPLPCSQICPPRPENRIDHPAAMRVPGQAGGEVRAQVKGALEAWGLAAGVARR
jgi:hypothetical protein